MYSRTKIHPVTSTFMVVYYPVLNEILMSQLKRIHAGVQGRLPLTCLCGVSECLSLALGSHSSG